MRLTASTHPLLSDLHPEQLAQLRLAHVTPPRAYHHFGHVLEVLERYAEVSTGPGWHQPREVLHAVLYHDAVYVPGRSDNEAESARLAKQHLQRWAAEVDADTVSRLILLTARHGSLASSELGEGGFAEDARHFLDCDMAILGADPVRFDAYDQAIAEEYRAVPRWLYAWKRKQFFRKLLGAERIFLSDFFRERLESRARKNIEAALAR